MTELRDYQRELLGRVKTAIPPDGVMLGDTPAIERDKLIVDFKDGKLKILVNVAVATEGFDLPDAGCVVLVRPTKSLALYLQMVGRGLRPKKITAVVANGGPGSDGTWKHTVAACMSWFATSATETLTFKPLCLFLNTYGYHPGRMLWNRTLRQ